jgi:hypothetical protein
VASTVRFRTVYFDRVASLRNKRSILLLNETVIGLFLDQDPLPQVVGVAKQSEMLVHESPSCVPMSVPLIATQKTNATSRTIKVYSTNPCPSSSTTNLLSSSIQFHPLSSPGCPVCSPKVFSGRLAVYWLTSGCFPQ